MKHISILPLYDATLTSIDSSHQLLTRVNDFMKYQGKPPFYNVEIVGLEKETKLNQRSLQHSCGQNDRPSQKNRCNYSSFIMW